VNEIKVIVISIGCDFGKRRQIAARVATRRTNSRRRLVSIHGVMNHIERPLENHAEVLPLQREESRRRSLICLKTRRKMPSAKASVAIFR
jgi:hypothetical protein